MKIGTSLRRGYQTQLSLPLDPLDPPLGLRLAISRQPATALVAASPPLPEPWAVEGLRAALTHRLGTQVRVEIHDNRSTMISYRRNPDGFALRLHRMFLPPPSDLAEKLSSFVVGRGRKRREAGRWLDAFIRAHQHAIRAPRPRPAPPSRGRTRDLKPIFDSLNQRFFAGAVEAEIGWSRAPAGRRRRSIKMGVYLHESRHIRIHPALDRPEVPDFFVDFVVYHEMCHQICPPESGPRGQKRIHTRAFRERERLHPDRDRALGWEKEHLKLLLRAEPPRHPAGRGYP